MPDISVVIPTRDRAGRLRHALASAVDQLAEGLEVIVVDDGSSDDTSEVAHSFGPTVRVTRLPESRGAAAARNAGLQRASGRHVAFLDDDDRWLPNKLRRQLAVLDDSNASVCGVACGYHVISDADGAATRTWMPPASPPTLRDFLQSTGFMTSVPLLRRDCLQAVGGFDMTLPACHDLDLWIRLSERYAFAAVSEVLVEHHIHPQQMTADLPRKVLAKERILAKHADKLRAHPDLLVRSLTRLALLHFAAGAVQQGQRCIQEALRVEPSDSTLLHHLRASRSDPAGHRQAVLRDEFARVGGVTLYY